MTAKQCCYNCNHVRIGKNTITCITEDYILDLGYPKDAKEFLKFGTTCIFFTSKQAKARKTCEPEKVVYYDRECRKCGKQFLCTNECHSQERIIVHKYCSCSNCLRMANASNPHRCESRYGGNAPIKRCKP